MPGDLRLAATSIPHLRNLDDPQRALLLALCRIDPSGPYPAEDAKEMTEQILGERISRTDFRRKIMRGLKTSNLIDLRQERLGAVRKTYLWTTPRFQDEVLVPYLETSTGDLDDSMKDYFNRRATEIYQELASSDPDDRSDALNAFTIYAMRLMGFHFVGWRQRADESAEGRETSLVAAGLVGGQPTRWQVRCINRPLYEVQMDDVAREVGLAVLTKSTHVLVVGNCPIADEAYGYAEQIAVQTLMTAIPLDRSDFERIQWSPGYLATAIADRIRRANWLRNTAPESRRHQVTA